MYQIYLTLKKIAEDYQKRTDKSQEFIKGFTQCLYLLYTGLKKYPYVNLHIENHNLKKEIEDIEYRYKKQISKLNMELDETAEELHVLRKLKIERDLDVVTVKVSDHITISFVTKAPAEFVKENISEVLNKLIINKQQLTEEKILLAFINFCNAKGYKSKKLR